MKQEQDRKLMPPPWLAYPETDRYSIGWRMGYGEDYIFRFHGWMDTLSQEEKEEYRGLFPEPVTWQGWWESEDTGELLMHGEYCVPAWRPGGEPAYPVERLCEETAGGARRDLCLFYRPGSSPDGSMTGGCLSQWWRGEFRLDVLRFCCMEQLMMEQKAELFGDDEIRQQILECQDPARIRTLGRKVRNFDQEVWDRFKYSIVLNGNWCKFSQNPGLRDFLLSTGESILAEASPSDAVWGIRLSADSPDARDPRKWRGRNLLGSALMEVRDELRRVTRNEALCDRSAMQADF